MLRRIGLRGPEDRRILLWRAARPRADCPWDRLRRSPTNGLRLPAARTATAIDRIPAFPRASRHTRKSRRSLAWPCSSEETTNSIGKLFPDRTLFSERAIATPGQGIDPPPSPAFGSHPATGEQVRLLEPMQHWVDRSLREIECLAAPAFDFLDDGVAMRGACR